MSNISRIARLVAIVSIFTLISFAPAPADAAVQTPEQYFGFTPGADGQLADYGQLVKYLQEIDAASERVEVRHVGTTPMDKPMYVVFISSADNIKRLDELRDINKRLALDTGIPEPERAQMIGEGKVFVMATLSMHSTEVGPSQALAILAHELATTADEAVLTSLSNVVLMITACHNPDGMDMVVDHYRKYAGTKYDGSSLPGIYHRYVGHDNNRDFVVLTQSDTRAIARLYSTEWYPQVMVEKHQMGSTGPRYYVPAVHDPIAENIDAGLWHWSALFGANLAKDMAADGHKGVASHWLFDSYWPGSTETSHWKNVISFLTEAASCKVASPIFVEPTELTGRGKGLSEYKKSVNMPEPWPGGWWRLADIVAYELSSTHSILHTAAANREAILTFRNDLCRAEVDRGRTQAPYYYILPAAQHDGSERVALVDLLLDHGVQVFELGERVELAGRVFEAGDVVVPLAQPYRPFVKEVMERQQFPVRHYTPGGEIIKPYDITSWSLPLHKGVRSLEIDVRSESLEQRLSAVDREWVATQRSVTLPDRFWGLSYSSTENQSYRAAFLALSRGFEVSRLQAADGTVPAGSFVIHGNTSELRELAEEVGVQPVALEGEPKTETIEQRNPRIGLIETWFHDMDAGWTRFVLDTYGVPFTVIRPGEMADLDLAADFDVLLFPDASKDVLTKGKYKGRGGYRTTDYPPEYTKGLGKEGAAKLVAFLNAGGIVVSSRGSTAVFLDGLEGKSELSDEPESVQLPARDISGGMKDKGLYVPGAVLRAKLIQDHPLTWGMPAETGVFSRGDPVFATSIPVLDTDRRVIATYPEKDILMSGYLDGEELLANKPVMVWLRRGEGQLVLFGFLPQFRASVPATYKLLFNSLLLPKWER